jgi:exopolysaccharide/PEP-CTERM locus tyrosine autokinase
MSLIELALQRVKADSAKGSAEKGPANAGQSLPVGAAARTEPVVPATVPAEPREPELFITEAFLREKGLLAPEAHEHQQRAEYRHIKYGLLREISRQGGHGLIFVTSALQGEGKSFSSMHLALSLASEQDYTVVLVDADVIRPSVSRLMGCEDRPGLMNALADPETSVESLILQTNVRGLSFLPAGRHEERATEFFSSARMAEISRQLLSVPNRIVVVDTLPLLLTTESRALASLGGQIVLVVRAESTPQNAVLEAIDVLGEGANVKLLLNASVRAKALEYYGFGHGYDYTTNSNNTNTKKQP